MEFNSTHLPELPQAPLGENELQITKLMSDLQRLNAENAVLIKEKQSLEKEKVSIEKDLKKSNDIIQRSKDRNCIQLLLEENAKLRDEADTLFGEKAQNDALKAQIYALSMKDDFKKLSSTEALSPIKNSTDLTAEIQILKAEKQAAEELLKQMRSDRDKLETQIRNQAIDLQEIKSLLELDKKKGATEATTAGRLWWGKGASNQSSVQSSAPTQNAELSTLSLTQHNTEKSSQATVSAPIDSVHSAKPEVAPVPVQAPGPASGVRSWWGGKSAAPVAAAVQSKNIATLVNANSTGSSDLAPVNQTPISPPLLESNSQQQLSILQSEIFSLKQDRDKLQSELDAVNKHEQDQKQVYETQIQYEKNRAVEAEQKIWEAQTMADDLKKSIMMLEDKLLQANRLIDAQKEGLEMKVKELMDITNNSKEESSQRSDDLLLLQQKYDSDIKQLKESQEKELETNSKMFMDKIALLQESLKLASSSDSDIIQNLEVKYKSIIEEKEGQIKSNNAENQIRIQALIYKHDEEVHILKQNLETKYKGMIQEKESQIKLAKQDYQSEIQLLTKKHDEELLSLKQSLENNYNSITQEKDQLIKLNHDDNQKNIQALVQKYEKELKSAKDDLETKYGKIIIDKEQLLKKMEEDTHDNIQRMLKKHSEELQSVREGIQTQENKVVAEYKSQLDKLNQGQKEFTESIKNKDAELLALNQKYQTERQKLQTEFDEKLKQAKASFDEKIRLEKVESGEKNKKEKIDLEAQFKKEKSELEDNFNKEKQKLVADSESKKKDISTLENVKNEQSKKLEKANADLEKIKKDTAATDSQKSESIKKLEKELSSNKDELSKTQAKAKSLETENSQLKTEKQKITETSEKKLKDNQVAFESKLQDYEQMKEQKAEMTSKIDQLSESIKRIESANQTQAAEYEVLKSSYDRTTKSNQEKEEVIKKLKTKSDELMKSENSLKKSITKAIHEKEVIEKELQGVSERLKTSEERMQQLQEEMTSFVNNSKQQTEQFSIIIAEKNELIIKIENLEKEYKLADRKNAIMIKDLQKQLLKERKKYDDDSQSQTDDTKNSKTILTEFKKIPEVGVPKLEKLTDDLILLHQDNENLKKSIKASDDQIKALHEKISKLSEESENKSKTIRQYILRDNASKLNPEDRSLNKGFNMNILSNASAMSKMDPAILSDINLKMQKLLEELTLRIQSLESQIKQC